MTESLPTGRVVIGCAPSAIWKGGIERRGKLNADSVIRATLGERCPSWRTTAIDDRRVISLVRKLV